MAAGRGTRISRHIDGKPKCTVPLGHTTLIEYSVQLLKKKGIADIAIILGYKGAVVRQLLGENSVKYYENPFYHVTNSIASLWFARDFLDQDEDYIFLNGDVFCEGAIIDEIIAETKSPVLFADTTRIEEADYKLFFPRGIVEKYGKELLPFETSGEYVGIAKVNRHDMPEFICRLEELITNGESSLWWENILYSLSYHRPIQVRDLAGLFWGEVDYIEDYERIQNYYQLNFS